MPQTNNENIIAGLTKSIANDVGKYHQDDLDVVDDVFNKAMDDALKSFNAQSFDDDGFIRKFNDLDLPDKNDKAMLNNVLNNIRSDYVNVESLNQSELLMRRDINNICIQMPEMRDTIMMIRDSIIECNVSTGQVSRKLSFGNNTNADLAETQVKELETQFDLLKAIKNFIVPNALRTGEMYVQITPYSKLFAELEEIHNARYDKKKHTSFAVKSPTTYAATEGYEHSLFNDDNVTKISAMMESVSMESNPLDAKETPSKSKAKVEDIKSNASALLKNLEVFNSSSIIRAEMGDSSFAEFVKLELSKGMVTAENSDGSFQHFMEENQYKYMQPRDNTFGAIDQDLIDTKKYENIKGCYIKYLDPLRLVPIRIDRHVIGYYYISTTMDLQTNPANPNGIVDLSFQNYTKDRNMVSTLANMVIKSFNKEMLERNIQLKNEIAEIIMAHKFSEGKLSFIYIPENEIVRFVVNEDEEGKGHSAIEPSVFPARMYLMLNLYNILYTLNNNQTRIHYLRSSGLDKNYGRLVQKLMRKFQSRRITIDDIYSYTGVLNKVGGMGELVMPTGRADQKAFDTETLEASPKPIDIDFLEQQRREALSGAGAPNQMVLNAINEVDFAKTLELANARFLSTVSSYKIDFNATITIMYQKIMMYCTDLDINVIKSFTFAFDAIKQPELNITADMIQNFNALVDEIAAMMYTKDQLEDEKGNPTNIMVKLRRELAKMYLPQIDQDQLEEIAKNINTSNTEENLAKSVKNLNIKDEDLSDIKNS